MTYEGMWSNDIWHGQGTLLVSDTQFVGQFVNGKKNGRGMQLWANG